MNKRELAGRLRDSTEAMRLQPSEVEHMLDMMADWGCLTVDDEPRPANAQLEGAEAEPPADNVPMIEPVTDQEEMYDDSDDDDDDEESESESEHRELVTPRVHRTKVTTKTKTKAKSARRR